MKNNIDNRIKKVELLERMLYMIRVHQYNPREELWEKIENLTDEIGREIIDRQKDREKNIGKEPGE